MKQIKHNTDGKFSWSRKGDQIIVYKEVTAKGQTEKVGVYEISQQSWHNNRKACLIPKHTREKIELACKKGSLFA